MIACACAFSNAGSASICSGVIWRSALSMAAEKKMGEDKCGTVGFLLDSDKKSKQLTLEKCNPSPRCPVPARHGRLRHAR